MTHSSVRGQLRFTPDAGRLQSPALVPACSWGAQKDSTSCSVALDCPAQPYHEAPPNTHTLPNPSRQDANVGFPRGAYLTCQAPWLARTHKLLLSPLIAVLSIQLSCLGSPKTLKPIPHWNPSHPHVCPPLAAKSPRHLELGQN